MFAATYPRLLQVSENAQPWLVLMEVLAPDMPNATLPTFDKDQDVMLFFKYYCPRTRKVILTYLYTC